MSPLYLSVNSGNNTLVDLLFLSSFASPDRTKSQKEYRIWYTLKKTEGAVIIATYEMACAYDKNKNLQSKSCGCRVGVLLLARQLVTRLTYTGP